MSEANLWSYVRRNLGPYGRLKRIENRLDKGTPDVAYTFKRASGWIELKHVPLAPARASTALKIPHLTLEQVQWLNDEHNAGGRAWCLLQVERRYFLLNPSVTTTLFEIGMTDGMLPALATLHWTTPFPTAALHRALTA